MFEAKVILSTDQHPCFSVHFAFISWIYMGTCITVFPTTDQTHIIFCLIELKLIENLVSIKKMMHIINDMQDKLYASTKSYCIYTVFNRGTESASGTPLGQSSATSVLIRVCHSGCKARSIKHHEAATAVVSWPAK